METDSILISIAMLKEVIAGKTYDAVAAQHGVTRTAIERRIKALALRLSREVGIEGLNEQGLAFVQRLRTCRPAITAALERYEPQISQEKRAGRILTDEDIRLAVQRTRTRSTCQNRDVALLYVLLTTGARPLDQAERSRKRVPCLMLVGNLRFSLPAILEWEMANSVPGKAAVATVEEVESPAEPQVPAKRWYEIVREQDGERFDSAP